jgi:alanine racemase
LPRTAWIEVDLDALTGNVAVLRALAGAGVEVLPVVKANAYGHGMVPVARALAAARVDGLCVATFDEAMALRTAGIAVRILVLFPIPAAVAAEARRAAIAVTVGDRQLLDELLAALLEDTEAPPLDVHLELETGLGRGGFGRADASRAARNLGEAPGARLVGAWTHLQAPEDEARSHAQTGAFDSITGELEREGLPPGFRHVSASGSLVLGEDVSPGGVRPGLATYGLIPDELLGASDQLGSGERGVEPSARGLRPILELRARPVRVADLPSGWGISYGPTFTTARPSRIATLPLGYGDGWSRALSNRAHALVRGERVPLVGNVAMDSVMADVTDVSGEPVTVHDEFVLIGAQGGQRITAADIAKARGTNSWEVVTNLAARLPRVYHAASVPREMRTLSGDAFANTDDATAAGRRSTRA